MYINIRYTCMQFKSKTEELIKIVWMIMFGIAVEKCFRLFHITEGDYRI